LTPISISRFNHLRSIAASHHQPHAKGTKADERLAWIAQLILAVTCLVTGLGKLFAYDRLIGLSSSASSPPASRPVFARPHRF